jgi:hypothetical protein
MAWVMMVLQVGCCLGACWKEKWWQALYWFGAALLTLAVVKGLDR